jgi:hypothetical protein
VHWRVCGDPSASPSWSKRWVAAELHVNATALVPLMSMHLFGQSEL